MPPSRFSTNARIATAKRREFSLVSNYKLGYRNREDVTNLPPGVLIVGSQNVFTNVSERVQIRKGYVLDGPTSSVLAPIASSFDWLTKNSGEVHLRAGFLTTAGNDGKLQYRYVDSLGAVTWRDLLTGLSSTSYNFTTFWDSSESERVSLFVNGESQIQQWNGAVASLASADNNSGYITNLAASPTAAGSGYLVGDVLTISGGIATATVTSVSGSNSGAIVSLQTVAGQEGSGYMVGDVLTIPTGSGGTITVTSIDGSGGVTGFDLTTNGSGYSQTAYNPTGGAGIGLQVYVSEIGGQSVAAVSLTTNGSGYSTGTGKVTTGGTGTGCTLDIVSVATGQITIAGNTSVLDSGFYTASNRSIVINGRVYTYTTILGESFFGINVDPSGETAGSVIHQSVVTILNSSMSGITSTFKNGLISVLNNQVFVGALDSAVVWISKVNDYTNYTSSTPRQTGEGASLVLDSQIVAFDPQENFMYVSAGQDLWYNVSFQIQTSTVGVTYEQVSALPLKTGRQQGAFSQAFVSHMKNNIIVVTNESTIDTFGRVETSLATPQQTNISDPIKLDVDSYDFTDGCIFYFRYNIYVAVPKEGLVLVYNLATGSWESPQVLPISRFYIVNGELYGHSYSTSESYQLFTGYADRVYPGFSGYPIDAVMKFSYENYGSRSTKKSANYLYIEGYINPSTTILASITYEIDGCATTKTFEIDGSDTQIVCIPTDQGPLGKTSLGKQKLGGSGTTSIQGLPPKFRVEKSFNNTDFFECSVSFEVLGVDNRMEILAWGLNEMASTQNPVNIRQ